jgi:NAD(P)-dependent dehydrogenase (short-subunit alcohol dehydrogenase family)
MTNGSHWTFENIPDQSGKIAIVTGANTGIGYHTARMLVEKGAEVVLACRNQEKGASAARKINLLSGPGKAVSISLDLSDLSVVRAFSEAVKARYRELHLLINNAGVMMPPFLKTSEGFELQFGVNHLGHFALTSLLFELLEKTPGSRVVNVSSAMHLRGKIDFNNLRGEKKYNKVQHYAQSKLANLLFTLEMQERYGGENGSVRILASHPGWTQTDLQRHISMARLVNPLFGMKADQGALPTLRAATDPEALGGDYYGPHGWRGMNGFPVKEKRINPLVYDNELRERLWQVSRKYAGVDF